MGMIEVETRQVLNKHHSLGKEIYNSFKKLLNSICNSNYENVIFVECININDFE